MNIEYQPSTPPSTPLPPPPPSHTTQTMHTGQIHSSKETKCVYTIDVRARKNTPGTLCLVNKSLDMFLYNYNVVALSLLNC